MAGKLLQKFNHYLVDKKSHVFLIHGLELVLMGEKKDENFFESLIEQLFVKVQGPRATRV